MQWALFTKEDQLFDTHLFMDHAVPGVRAMNSEILDQARAVFCGRKVAARCAGDGCDSVDGNLLLNRSAKVNTMPQLKIMDDVKCTHGATIGELDEQALFYLQTRVDAKRACDVDVCLCERGIG